MMNGLVELSSYDASTTEIVQSIEMVLCPRPTKGAFTLPTCRGWLSYNILLLLTVSLLLFATKWLGVWNARLGPERYL
jgi:hypothetical protein